MSKIKKRLLKILLFVGIIILSVAILFVGLVFWGEKREDDCYAFIDSKVSKETSDPLLFTPSDQELEELGIDGVIPAQRYYLMKKCLQDGKESIILDLDHINKITSEKWVTYKNDQYNFSLEHPSDWTVKEELKGVFTFSKAKPSTQQIKINFYKDIGKVSAEEYVNKYFYKDYTSPELIALKGKWSSLTTYSNTEIPPYTTETYDTKIVNLVASEGYTVMVFWSNEGNDGVSIQKNFTREEIEYFDRIMSTLKLSEFFEI